MTTPQNLSASRVGILSTAQYFPEKHIGIDDIFKAEGVQADSKTFTDLGVKGVHVFEGENPTDMAVTATQRALENGGITASDLDVIIDFSIMPQKYVEPAWSMSNELQAEISARQAFTLGFSGAGCANIHVAIKFGTTLIQANSDVDTVLLVASDHAIPGNRIVNEDNPVTVIGDGASALILQRGAPNATIIDTSLSSLGHNHDVLNIPGGGMAHPTRLDWYKLMIDPEKYNSTARMSTLKNLSTDLLRKHSLGVSDIEHFITSNISKTDIDDFVDQMEVQDRLVRGNIERYGHIHATDLVLNYMSTESAGLQKGDYLMMASHGMGFVYGSTLLQY